MQNMATNKPNTPNQASSATPTGRDRLMERLAKKHPDKAFADDEALYGQIGEDYDEYETSAQNYRDKEKAMSDLFDRDGRSAAFLDRWSKGDDPVALLVRIFGPELRESLDDPQKAAALSEASKEYMERMAKQKEYEDNYARNLQESYAQLEQMEQNGEISPDDTDRALAILLKITCNALQGIFSAQHIRLALNAANHDSDVAQATHEGEVRGRNAKITEGLKKRTATDGTANLGGMHGRAARNAANMSMFDLAAEAN